MGPTLVALTGGVPFDLNGDGRMEIVAWPQAGSDDSWLVLDRNGNGNIDNGVELFGNFSPGLNGRARNGFEALGIFDLPSNGGNNDGIISAADEVFVRLRLWRDQNRNGIAEPSELSGLSVYGITGISLMAVPSRQVDLFGNRFILRSRVIRSGFATPRWIWDVLPLSRSVNQ